ncbi:unnamed protein product, partial [Discosporangium mesarthrocarpum]
MEALSEEDQEEAGEGAEAGDWGREPVATALPRGGAGPRKRYVWLRGAASSRLRAKGGAHVSSPEVPSAATVAEGGGAAATAALGIGSDRANVLAAVAVVTPEGEIGVGTGKG